MFKSVDYVGFEGKLELLAQAERANLLLAGEIRTWREDVEVVWRPATNDPRATLELTLGLKLPNAAGTGTGNIRKWVFDPGEEGELRSDLRGVWLNLLDVLIDQMAKNREASSADLVEV